MASNWNTIRLDPADIAYSKYRRNKARWICSRCGRHADGQGMHLAHFHARRKESVRFDDENTDVLCANCHRHLTNHYNEHKEWKLQQLGQQAYDLLTLRANSKGDKSLRPFLAKHYRQLLKKEFPDA